MTYEGVHGPTYDPLIGRIMYPLIGRIMTPLIGRIMNHLIGRTFMTPKNEDFLNGIVVVWCLISSINYDNTIGVGWGHF